MGIRDVVACSLRLLFFAFGAAVQAQEFFPLWSSGSMPNSKGLLVKDSIARERVFSVGTPGMYVFVPSQEERNGTSVIICPGGGYQRLAYNISGFQLAKWYNTLGMTAFVLNYRLPNSSDLVQGEVGPLADVQRAIKWVRARSASWGLDKNRVGVQGSSAGGHLAALVCNVAEDYSLVRDTVDAQSFSAELLYACFSRG